MNIAIAAQENDLTTLVACHFGRCEFFFIYNEEKKSTFIIPNDRKDDVGCVGGNCPYVTD
ncbi:MAG: hypothetical protein M0P58_12005 [Bacteroidales bacterium]|jgi:predicted Fe-Mo cluster-binding NifX family protein|nr:hypothetical protein [Bacteroidales bacterium]